jgi:recombination protein RecA
MGKKPLKKRLGRRAIAGVVASVTGKEECSVRVMRAEDLVPRAVLPTGHDNLDAAITIGGLPTGRLITYNGPPGCGKTTRAIENIEMAQRLGGLGVYFDFESKLDLPYVQTLGVDMPGFVYSTPRYIEEGFGLTEKLITALREEDEEAPVVFVWDSASAAKCKASFEADWDDFNMAREARVYANHLPRFARLVAETNAIVIGITQQKVKIEGMGKFSVIKDKIGPGNTWEHQTALVLSWVRRQVIRAKVKGGKGKKGKAKSVRLGMEISTIEVIKNQVGPAWEKAEMMLRYGEGYDPVWSTFQMALAKGLITKSGAWYSIDDVRLGQGADNAVETLRNDEDMLADLRIPLRAGYEAPVVGYEGGYEEDED